jgi:hypothetical protein
VPDILYLLEPPTDWITQKDLKAPPMKEYQIHGKYLRDIPILPDHISSKVEGWRVQAWYGFDSRLKLADILARIGKQTNGNTIMMRMLRFRTDFPALGWSNKGPNFDADKLKIEQLMTEASLDPACGSTRGLAWGLVNPDNQNSQRIMIPHNKAWESSVEVSTAAHLTHIPSPMLSVHPQSATEMPQPRSQHDMRASDTRGEYMISDGEEDIMEAADDWLVFETPDAPAIQAPPIYPRPEEVPRPLSITNPLEYQQRYGVEKKGTLMYHPCF